MRCFALAEVIKNLNFDVCFISKRLEENIYDFISKKGYKIYYISNNNNHNNLIQNDVLDTKKISNFSGFFLSAVTFSSRGVIQNPLERFLSGCVRNGDCEGFCIR